MRCESGSGLSKGRDVLHLAQQATSRRGTRSSVDERRRPACCPRISRRRQRPRWCEQATTPGRDALGHPGPVDEVADLGAHAHQVAVLQPQATGVAGVDPERVAVRDLAQVLGVPAAGVDQGRQPEGRQQHHLALRGVEARAVDVAARVARQGLLGPAPLGHRRREELQPAGRGRETRARHAVDLDRAHAARPSTLTVAASVVAPAVDRHGRMASRRRRPGSGRRRSAACTRAASALRRGRLGQPRAPSSRRSSGSTPRS